MSKWELGESYPTVENIFKLCSILKCKMNELINEGLSDFELLGDDIKHTEKLYERFLGYADIVICSQAFHWMNPESTIKEVYRLLKKGGIFAVIDADYPPVINKELEQLYAYLHKKTSSLEKCDNKWVNNKTEHLSNIRKSGLFEYSREICFSHIEEYDQERFKKFLLSQSSMQHAIKYNYDKIIDELNILDEKLYNVFNGHTLNAMYSYKMRIGIK